MEEKCSMTGTTSKMKNTKLLLSFFICIAIAVQCRSQEEEFAGPFRVVVRQIDQCDDSGTRQAYMSSTRITKVSRTKYLFSTNVTFLIPVTDDITGVVEIAKFGNGGWRPHFMDLEFPHFCTSMREAVPVYFKAILKSLRTEECPIPVGNYELIDLDMEDLKIGPSIPVFPYGKYRADYSGVINGTVIGCIRYYLDVVPKKRARQQKKP